MKSNSFQIKLSDNQPLLIVSLVGTFSIAHLIEIQNLAARISELDEVKFVILDTTELVEVDSNMIFSYAKIQQSIRGLGHELRICGTSAKLKKKLFERGVLRENEACDNLAIAIKSLLNSPKFERRNARKPESRPAEKSVQSSQARSGRNDPLAA